MWCALQEFALQEFFLHELALQLFALHEFALQEFFLQLLFLHEEPLQLFALHECFSDFLPQPEALQPLLPLPANAGAAEKAPTAKIPVKAATANFLLTGFFVETVSIKIILLLIVRHVPIRH